jgi:hypothetical protein
VRNQGCGLLDVPGQAKLFGEDIASSGGQQRQRGVATGDAIDYFVERTIATAGDYQLAASGNCTAGESRGSAGRIGGREFGVNAMSRKHTPSAFEDAEAGASGTRIEDEQGIVDRPEHQWSAPAAGESKPVAATLV